MTRFVLCGMPRSGTTVVGGALHAHPNVLFYGELFNDVAGVRRNEAARVTLGAGWQVATAPDERALRPCGFEESGYRYLEDFYAAASDSGAVGFKLLWDQAAAGANADAWRYLVEQPELRVIRIRRDNVLDIVCSYVRARLTRRWHSTGGVAANPRFVLPPHECAPLFERFSRLPPLHDRLVAEHPVLDVDYADIEHAFAGTMTRIFAFLEVDAQPSVQPRLEKIARYSPAEAIANYAELKRHFADSPYARHFIY